MASNGRKYELVLFGATGYTGKYTAEHITKHLPTNLKWALAGRSTSKLTSLADDLKELNSDRAQPELETCSLKLADLEELAQKTQLIINTVGPYCKYGTNVVEACAKNGTHYIDSTGEVPWVKEMIEKYHDIAKSNGAIIIPQAGFESAFSDLLTYSLVSLVRQKLSTGIKQMTVTLWDLKSNPSGGTLATAFALLDVYSLSQIAKSMVPFALSPIPGPKQASASLYTLVTGVRRIPDLGLTTTAITGSINTAIVGRSWGLLDGGKYYGQKFQYGEYAAVSNTLIGVAIHYALGIGGLVLAIPPLKWIIKQLVYSPGEGPSKKATENDGVEFRAVAVSDGTSPKRAFGRMAYEGSMYDLTGFFLAYGAITILRDDTAAKRMGGGILTPATLGQPFIDRVKAGGLVLESRMMD